MKNITKKRPEQTKSKNKQSIFERKFNTMIITVILIIFFIGFFAGWFFSDDSLNELEINYGLTQLDLNSISERFEFANTFENENMCNPKLFEDVSKQLYESRITLTNLEKEEKIDTKYYQFLKERHNLNQVYFYSEYKRFYESCNNLTNIIVFFFDGGNPIEAEQQGLELDKAFQANNNIIILPMDYKYSENLDYFYDYYNTQELPTLVINYKYILKGQTEADEILKFLNNN